MSEEEQLPLHERELAEVDAARSWQMLCLHFDTTCIFVMSITAFGGGIIATIFQNWMYTFCAIVVKLVTLDMLVLCAMLCSCRVRNFISSAYHAVHFFAFAGWFWKIDLSIFVGYAICGLIAIAFKFEWNCGNKCAYRKKYWMQHMFTMLIHAVGSVLSYGVFIYLCAVIIKDVNKCEDETQIMDRVLCISVNILCGLWLKDVKTLLIPVLLCVAVERTVSKCKKWWSKQTWKTRVKQAEIAWVACSALRTWAAHADKRLMRRQRLERTDFFLESEINDVWCKPRRFVVSHAWLSKSHPDPDGQHLQELVAELDRLHAKNTDVVFLDYCSLYQTDLSHPDAIALRQKERLPVGHPALRTPDQSEKFERAMSMMHELYTFEESEVVVLPSVPHAAANNTPYFARGWCFFEFAISTDHWRVINDRNLAVNELLTSTNAPMDDSEFVTEFAKKSFTCKGDDKTVLSLYKQLYQNETGRNLRRKWLQISKHVTLWLLSLFLAFVSMYALAIKFFFAV